MQMKGIRTQHPEYTRMLPIWERCERAAEGEIAVHAAAELELPRLEGETEKPYATRLMRTPFFNATWRTISGLKGMLFRNSPKVTTPAAIEPYLADIDMAGTPMGLFAQEIAEEVLTVGRVGILVDHPSMPMNSDGSPLTVAQAERLGLRPMLAKYSAKSVINWKCARVNNAMQLVLVVLKESAPIGEDAYSHDAEDIYRELTLTQAGYRQRVFRINKQGLDEQVGDDIYPRIGGNTLQVIPFTFIGTDDISADIETPPLLDLVTMNYHHYRVGSDYEHGCHFSGLPTPVITGYRASETDYALYVGGSAIITLPDPQATASYMEVKNDFEALRKNKDDKKAEMAVLGARMLEQQRASVEAAETLQTRSQGEQSQLAAMAQVLSIGLTKALQWFAAWAGATGDATVEINRDFVPVGMTAQELTALVAAWQSGMPGASGQNVYALMQKKEMADPAVTYEEEQERIASAGPIGVMG
jgi:hypothetical protein